MTNQSKCCEKCHAYIKAFPSSPDCDNPNCKCHTPTEKKCENCGKSFGIEALGDNDICFDCGKLSKPEESREWEAEKLAREFCKKTPMIKRESGVAFYERLRLFIHQLLLSKETEVKGKIEALRNKYPPNSKPQVALYQEALDDVLNLFK